jgi:hypothetical protein
MVAVRTSPRPSATPLHDVERGSDGDRAEYAALIRGS